MSVFVMALGLLACRHSLDEVYPDQVALDFDREIMETLRSQDCVQDVICTFAVYSGPDARVGLVEITTSPRSVEPPRLSGTQRFGLRAGKSLFIKGQELGCTQAKPCSIQALTMPGETPVTASGLVITAETKNIPCAFSEGTGINCDDNDHP
jgi:hypothetical protein